MFLSGDHFLLGVFKKTLKCKECVVCHNSHLRLFARENTEYLNLHAKTQLTAKRRRKLELRKRTKELTKTAKVAGRNPKKKQRIRRGYQCQRRTLHHCKTFFPVLGSFTFDPKFAKFFCSDQNLLSSLSFLAVTANELGCWNRFI